MKKYIKKHLKDEKRILKLMYKKGIFEILRIDFKNLTWEYLIHGKSYRRRKRKTKYVFYEHLPKLYEFVKYQYIDVIEIFKEYLSWESRIEGFNTESGFPINKKYLTTKTLINYLNKLRTVNNDSKFNKFLIINRE